MTQGESQSLCHRSNIGSANIAAGVAGKCASNLQNNFKAISVPFGGELQSALNLSRWK
jgi:hypothetical protein